MFRHVAMFRWNEQTTEADVATISEALDRLAATIPQIRRYHHGADVALSEENFDYVVIADFADAGDFVIYRDNPDHQDLIATTIRPHLHTRAAVQFEVRDGADRDAVTGPA